MSTSQLKEEISETFWERTGLDWIPVLLNEDKYFPKTPGLSLERIDAIKRQAQELEERVLDDIIIQYEKLTENTKSRWEYVESKASNLINFTTIGSTFIIGFNQLSFDTTRNLMSLPLRITVMIIYVAIAASLFITITIARKTFAVTTSSSPKPSDLLSLRDWNRLYIRQQYAASLLIAHEYNTAIINKKVTFMKGAERWFGNIIILLMTLLTLLAVGLLVPSNQVHPTVQEPVLVILLTPTPVIPVISTTNRALIQNPNQITQTIILTGGQVLQSVSPLATITLTPNLTHTSIYTSLP